MAFTHNLTLLRTGSVDGHVIGTPALRRSETCHYRRTSRELQRMVRFLMDGNEYQAIEQNPERPSHWGKLAHNGHKVVQFRDLRSQKYVAVTVDGNVREYVTGK